jgi:hypothetical protein
MTQQHDNPNAFPQVGNSTWSMEPSPGMTLRDWFAGQFAGGCANSLTRAPEDEEEWALAQQEIGSIARLSYLMADAMLAARTPQVPA